MLHESSFFYFLEGIKDGQNRWCPKSPIQHDQYAIPPKPESVYNISSTFPRAFVLSILILLVHARMWCQIWRFRSLRSLQGQTPWCRFPWTPWDWRMITLYSWKHCISNTNHKSLTDSTWQLQMPSKDSVNFECRLAKPKLNVTLPGSTGICKKKLGWFNQQDASMATKICLPATWPNHTKLRRFKKQDSPPKNLWSQGQTARSMHPLSAMSWALLLCTRMGPLLADSQANLYSLYRSTCTRAKLHTLKNTHNGH